MQLWNEDGYESPKMFSRCSQRRQQAGNAQVVGNTATGMQNDAMSKSNKDAGTAAIGEREDGSATNNAANA
jgi:hypothetical protein